MGTPSKSHAEIGPPSNTRDPEWFELSRDGVMFCGFVPTDTQTATWEGIPCEVIFCTDDSAYIVIHVDDLPARHRLKAMAALRGWVGVDVKDHAIWEVT